MKAYLEAQTQAQTPAPSQAEPREWYLKAYLPNLYYGNLQLDCYRFCKQCEDHFDTAGATGSNRIPFASSFLSAAHRRSNRFGQILADVFLEESAAVLPERTDINEHAIELQEDQPGKQLHPRQQLPPFFDEWPYLWIGKAGILICRLKRWLLIR